MKPDIFRTRWGWIGLQTTARGIAAVVLPLPSHDAVRQSLETTILMNHLAEAECERAIEYMKSARTWILSYLEGTARSIDLPLDLEAHSIFQRTVWASLRTIPYGRVRSYGWVARKVGRPMAARAVGNACGANPVPLFVPCHRVIAGDGSLGGFSGGLLIKKRLLILEGVLRR